MPAISVVFFAPHLSDSLGVTIGLSPNSLGARHGSSPTDPTTQAVAAPRQIRDLARHLAGQCRRGRWARSPARNAGLTTPLSNECGSCSSGQPAGGHWRRRPGSSWSTFRRFSIGCGASTSQGNVRSFRQLNSSTTIPISSQA